MSQTWTSVWMSDAYCAQNRITLQYFISPQWVSGRRVNLETKPPWHQTLYWNKQAIVFTSVTVSAQHQWCSKLAQYSWINCTLVSYHRDIDFTLWCPQTWSWTNYEWSLYVSVRPLGQLLANYSRYVVQTFCCQSEGLATVQKTRNKVTMEQTS